MAVEQDTHYRVEEFKTAKALDKRANALFDHPTKPYYVYLMTQTDKGYTVVFAESRVKKVGS